jgi:hypothetical protein
MSYDRLYLIYLTTVPRFSPSLGALLADAFAFSLPSIPLVRPLCPTGHLDGLALESATRNL